MTIYRVGQPYIAERRNEMNTLDSPTSWRWAKARASRVLQGIAPVRPQPHTFVPSSDPATLAQANLAQWFIPANQRLVPGTLLYTARATISCTLRSQPEAQAKIARRREQRKDAPWLSADIRALAKMSRHVAALSHAGLPAYILVIDHRLHQCSIPPTPDPNDDWGNDGTEVQVVVKNIPRIMALLLAWASRQGIRLTPPSETYCGLKTRTEGAPDWYWTPYDRELHSKAVAVRRLVRA